MAPPFIEVFMPFTIWFRDTADYNAALALSGGNPLVAIAPRDLATLFGIPFPYPTGDLDAIPKGISFQAPFLPGIPISLPPYSALGAPICDDTLNEIIWAAQGGDPPAIWAPDKPVHFIWSGQVIQTEGADSSSHPPGNACSRRRWIMGFERIAGATGSEGIGMATANEYGRDMSRTVDGMGACLRGASLSGAVSKTISEYRTGLISKTSWERMYFRVQAIPTTQAQGLWRCHGTPADNAGFGLKLETTGDIKGFSYSGAGAETDRGVVFTPILDTWYRMDILLKFDTGALTDGRIRIFMNGTEVFSLTEAGSIGLNGGTSHTRSEIGRWTVNADNGVEVDIDDCFSADLPANCSATTLIFSDTDYPMDWILGSHIRAHYVRTPATFNNWTAADIGKLNHGDNPITDLSAGGITDSTSGDLLTAIADVALQSIIDTAYLNIGVISAIVGAYQKNAAGTDGKIGYSIAGGAPVLTTIDQQAVAQWHSVAYLPNGLIIPDEVSPLGILHQKSADANLSTLYALVVECEYLGVFGPEDDPTCDLGLPRHGLEHNSKYTNSIWGYVGSPTASPVCIISDKYVGTNLYQEILLPCPVHFLWIRNAAGTGTGGLKYFASSIGAHFGATDREVPNLDTFTDLAGNTFFCVDGDSLDVNRLGETYQYVAFCDPGGRFNRTGSYCHGPLQPSPKVNTLIDPNFTAEAGFVQKDNIGAISNNEGLFYKGPGMAGSIGKAVGGGGVLNNFGTFGVGSFSSETPDTNVNNGNTHYSLWRTTEEGCAGVMVQIGQYTGNGAPNQVVNITPVSGRYPVFVLVVPANAVAAYMRDVSHAGAHSSLAGALTDSTTAIIALGQDQITVGATLNTNNIVYSYFILPGDDAGVADGLYFNILCQPPDAGKNDPTPIFGDIVQAGEGGILLGGAGTIQALEDIGGIYTMVTDKRNDTVQDKLPGIPTIDYEIPDPHFKTGYIGG